MPEARLRRTREAYTPRMAAWLLERQRAYHNAELSGDDRACEAIFLEVVNRCAQAVIALDIAAVDLPAANDARWPAWSEMARAS